MIKHRLRNLRAEDIRLAIATIVVAAPCACFVVIAHEIMEGETFRFDKAVLIALRHETALHIPIGPEWLLQTMTDISALGGTSLTVIIVAIIGGFFCLINKYRALIYLLVSVCGGAFVMQMMKGFFNRPRPTEVPHLQEITETSFPSGHSMVAAIVYLTLAAILAKTTKSHKLKAYYLAVALSLALLIGLSRIYLGVHYPSDVIAGWLAGAVWASLTYLIGDWLEKRGQIEHEDPS